MKLIALLLHHFKFSFFAVLIFSLASAAIAVLILAFINQRMIQNASVIEEVIIQFSGLLVVLFMVSAITQVTMTSTGHRLVYQLRRALVKRVLDTDLERLELLGPAQIMAALNTDIRNIAAAFISLPVAIFGITLIIGGFFYLAWLSWPLFIAISIWLSLTVVIGWLLLKRTHLQACLARDVEGRLYENYQAIIEGRKELALNRARARYLYECEFDSNARDSLGYETKADIFNGVNENWVNSMILGAIGLSFFLAHGFGWADAGVAATYALVILFLRTPLTAVVSSIPRIVIGNVSVANLEALELPDYKVEFALPQVNLPENWRNLHLDSVTYSYPGVDEHEGFAIGPLELSLCRGETIFLIGGNGGGKTTLARLLTGLYRPHAGRIHMDGLLIDEHCQSSFRRLFSAVFADFHLFDQFLDESGQCAETETIHYWLNILQMTGKAQIQGGRLRTECLSQGQRKRMALLLAILENRPVLVLDEWAADQDPAFRSVFYNRILPELKAAGKTILAITHDEHYFYMADRLLKIDGGQLLELKRRQTHTSYEFIEPVR